MFRKRKVDQCGHRGVSGLEGEPQLGPAGHQKKESVVVIGAVGNLWKVLSRVVK